MDRDVKPLVSSFEFLSGDLKETMHAHLEKSRVIRCCGRDLLTGGIT